MPSPLALQERLQQHAPCKALRCTHHLPCRNACNDMHPVLSCCALTICVAGTTATIHTPWSHAGQAAASAAWCGVQGSRSQRVMKSASSTRCARCSKQQQTSGSASLGKALRHTLMSAANSVGVHEHTPPDLPEFSCHRCAVIAAEISLSAVLLHGSWHWPQTTVCCMLHQSPHVPSAPQVHMLTLWA